MNCQQETLSIILRFWGLFLFFSVIFVSPHSFGNPFKQCNSSPIYQDSKTIPAVEPWSGTRDDIQALIAEAKKQYGFESESHKGRDAVELKPASLQEMVREINRGNQSQWTIEPADNFHQPEGVIKSWLFAEKSNVKFTNPAGGEVVYSLRTGKIVTDEHIGTYNFTADYSNNKVEHTERDVVSHGFDSKYKYVGILFESDPVDPNKYYIVDGQTGKRMTPGQVRDFPTTLTDMWKDMGLVCEIQSWNEKVADSLARGTTVDEMSEWVQSVAAIMTDNEILKSLADLLETGEELVEVRQDMREERAERKAAEEAERLRQQQLEEQRRKENEKKRDKKSEKTNNKKDTTPTPASSSTSIDFSKLNSLISQQASLLRSLLASGEKASSAQRSQFNSLNSQYAAEFNRLKTQIGSISDASLRSQYYNELASINSRMNSEVDPLLAQGERAGIFTNL